MNRLFSYLRASTLTAINIVLYALSAGRFLWLEGRVHKGDFQNWARNFSYKPCTYIEPETEDEIRGIVRDASKIRVFGAGHSFNRGIRSEEVLLSLDRYSGVVSGPAPDGKLRVKAGTRVRDVSRELDRRGYALSALPSHDAQSIGGILSTDVHGTGRDWGFVSEHVTALRIIDGNGEPHDCTPSDPLFQAAIGGVGAVGIITEVEVSAVDAFRLEQIVEFRELDWIEENLEDLLNSNAHVSFYFLPFTTRCQVNRWNPTSRPRSLAGKFREFLLISWDACGAVALANAVAYLGALPRVSRLFHRLKSSSNLVLESYEGFNRSIYHLHQELEFAVPFKEALNETRRFMALYERLYEEKPLPYVLIEVRFTPADHDKALIGPGRDRRSAWIDLVAVDSVGFEPYYAAAEAELRRLDARPHLGKWCKSWTPADLRRLYGTHFDTFLALVQRHDPRGVFRNDLTASLFPIES